MWVQSLVKTLMLLQLSHDWLMVTISLIFLILPNLVGSQEFLSNSRCNHYPERGTCETSFEVKWFYDRFSHRCRQFFYGGCDGNDNRFNTLAECRSTCHFEPAIDDSSEKRCFQPLDHGGCWGNFERWVFDATLGKCICSWWSGCGGNSNRFFSYNHCMQICSKHVKVGSERANIYELPSKQITESYQPTIQPRQTKTTAYPFPASGASRVHMFAKPRDTLPLGGNALYLNHISTPQHPPIYDDPDLFNIEVGPVFHQNSKDDSFQNDYKSKEWPSINVVETEQHPQPKTITTAERIAKTEVHLFPENSSVEVAKDKALKKPLETIPESDMLLNLKPPSDDVERAIVKRTVSEVVETPFRTFHRNRKTTQAESFEAPAVKAPRANYQRYDTPVVSSDQQQNSSNINYVRTAQRNRHLGAGNRQTKTFYHEYAETPFKRPPYYYLPPSSDSYPILRTVDPRSYQTIPVPVSQELLGQLIAQHKTLLARQGIRRYHEVRETPFRRLSGHRRTVGVQVKPKITYADKRRLWKEVMKKKMRKPKIPARPMQRSGSLYVAYSPHNGMYQVNRFPPPGWFNQTPISTVPTNQVEVPLSTTTSAPSTTITTKTLTTITTPAPTTLQTTTQKILRLEVESIPVELHRYQIRTSAIKPTSNTPLKQLIYIDDYDEISSFEDDATDIEVNEPLTPTPTHQPRQSQQSTYSTNVSPSPLSDGISPIVFPADQRSLAPTEYVDSEVEKDYTDYGQSEEDLFFWKPEHKRHRNPGTRINPSTANNLPASEDSVFEITVHNPIKKI